MVFNKYLLKLLYVPGTVLRLIEWGEKNKKPVKMGINSITSYIVSCEL